MNLEPAKADPENVARKVAAAPGLKLPPEPSYDLLPDGRVANYRMQNMGLRRKVRNRIGQVVFNLLITHIPFHFIRLGFLRLFGATSATTRASARHDDPRPRVPDDRGQHVDRAALPARRPCRALHRQ